jgi:hypothetical protein
MALRAAAWPFDGCAFQIRTANFSFSNKPQNLRRDVKVFPSAPHHLR